jgi:hypothetical protein
VILQALEPHSAARAAVTMALGKVADGES